MAAVPDAPRTWRFACTSCGACCDRSPEVLRKRPYIEPEWCASAIAQPIRRETQGDGRIRFWREVTFAGETEPRVLRVVTLEDGETVHNAFFDRNFPKEPR